MKNFKKLMSIAMAFVMTTALLAGCSVEEKTLVGAFMKNATMTSGESKTKMQFNIGIEGISAEDQKASEQILNLINAMPIELTSKQIQAADKSTAKAQMDLKVMNMDMGSLWTSQDIAKGEALTVVKIPQALGTLLPPTMQGKDYIVLDTKEMMNMPEMKEAAGKVDYTKLMDASKNLLPKLTTFLTKYMEQFNPDLKLVTDLGAQKIKTPDGLDVDTHMYEFKLDDASAKVLLKYTVTNLLQNKETILGLKDVFVEFLKAAGMTDKDLAELDKEFADFDKNAPELMKSFDQAMDMLKDVTILGKKGIDIKFAIDANGYLVSQEGILDFVLDMGKLNAMDKNMGELKKAVDAKVGESNVAANLPIDKSMENAIIKFGLNYSSVNYKINDSSIAITMPSTNSTNSIGFAELMKVIEASVAPTTPVVKPTTKPTIPTKPVSNGTTITIKKANSITNGKAQYVTIDALKSLGGKITIAKNGVTVSLKGKNVTVQQGVKTLTINGKKTVLVNPTTIVKNKKIYVSVEVLTKAGFKVVIK